MNLIHALIGTSYHVCIRTHSRAGDVEDDEGSFLGHARMQLTVGCSVSVGAIAAEMYRLAGPWLQQPPAICGRQRTSQLPFSGSGS